MRETWPVPVQDGEEAREEDAMTDGAGRGPSAGRKQAPHLWTMVMRQKVRANRTYNSAVQAVISSRGLLTSRRREECRCSERIECDSDNSAGASAVIAVVQAMLPSQVRVNAAPLRKIPRRPRSKTAISTGCMLGQWAGVGMRGPPSISPQSA